MSIDTVLGINRRNIEFVMSLNRREHFVLVDNKIVTKSILEKNGIPGAKMLGSIDSFFGIDGLLQTLSEHPGFVLKPACGSGGNGIVVVKKHHGEFWQLANDEKWDKAKQVEHIQNILYGTFSSDTTGDCAFAEELIQTHPELLKLSSIGLPDIRIIIHKGTPVISMIRVPTRMSQGKANLHAGGFAIAIDIATGITGQGWFRGKAIEKHPEKDIPLAGIKIPFWKDMIDLCPLLYTCFPLGYMGVDFAVDSSHGPLILELNARPGLEIQNVSGTGIRTILERS